MKAWAMQGLFNFFLQAQNMVSEKKKKKFWELTFLPLSVTDNTWPG